MLQDCCMQTYCSKIKDSHTFLPGQCKCVEQTILSAFLGTGMCLTMEIGYCQCWWWLWSLLTPFQVEFLPHFHTAQRRQKHLMSQHRTALQRRPGWAQNRKEGCCTWVAVPKIISPANWEFSIKIHAFMTKKNFCDCFLVRKKIFFPSYKPPNKTHLIFLTKIKYPKTEIFPIWSHYSSASLEGSFRTLALPFS